ncbi:MAG: hypothetical protein ACRD3N_04310 [Terracidiphilus sp.]
MGVTPPSDAMDLPTQVTQEAPLYSDLKVLQIPVRGLRAGDTLLAPSSRRTPKKSWFDVQKTRLDVPTGCSPANSPTPLEREPTRRICPAKPAGCAFPGTHPVIGAYLLPLSGLGPPGIGRPAWGRQKIVCSTG